ncbi:MAG: hypothetical protein JST84_25015 [Acidobacteria bacterium]|nr:hypothetical protein [Acidobacteriota bacterium]
MRAQDGYIYATEAPAGAAIPRIFRIDSTGFLTSLGQPVGLPGGADKYVTGAIGADGFYYIRQQNQNTLYRIDVSGGAATLAATVAIGAGEVLA